MPARTRAFLGRWWRLHAQEVCAERFAPEAERALRPERLRALPRRSRPPFPMPMPAPPREDARGNSPGGTQPRWGETRKILGLRRAAQLLPTRTTSTRPYSHSSTSLFARRTCSSTNFSSRRASSSGSSIDMVVAPVLKRRIIGDVGDVMLPDERDMVAAVWVVPQPAECSVVREKQCTHSCVGHESGAAPSERPVSSRRGE